MITKIAGETQTLFARSLEVAGETYGFYDEPTPRLIDELIRGAGELPLGQLAVRGIDALELDGMYRSNGWSIGPMQVCWELPRLSKFLESVKLERGLVPEGALVGPIVTSKMILSGAALWVPRYVG